MAGSDRASISGHVPKDFLDEFDEYYGAGQYGSRSRSELIERAMREMLATDRAVDATGYSFDDDRALKSFKFTSIRTRRECEELLAENG